MSSEIEERKINKSLSRSELRIGSSRSGLLIVVTDTHTKFLDDCATADSNILYARMLARMYLWVSKSGVGKKNWCVCVCLARMFSCKVAHAPVSLCVFWVRSPRGPPMTQIELLNKCFRTMRALATASSMRCDAEYRVCICRSMCALVCDCSNENCEQNIYTMSAFGPTPTHHTDCVWIVCLIWLEVFLHAHRCRNHTNTLLYIHKYVYYYTTKHIQTLCTYVYVYHTFNLKHLCTRAARFGADVENVYRLPHKRHVRRVCVFVCICFINIPI